MNKNIFFDILGERAKLSMLGKGIIGLTGGILITIVVFYRNCSDRGKTIESPNAAAIENRFIKPAVLADSFKIEYYKKLGVPTENVGSVVGYIYNHSKGGIIIRGLEDNEYQYLKILNNYMWPTKNISQHNSYYYIVSLDSADFILVTSDSLLNSIVKVAEK